jgi:hypothetical protein
VESVHSRQFRVLIQLDPFMIANSIISSQILISASLTRNGTPICPPKSTDCIYQNESVPTRFASRGLIFDNQYRIGWKFTFPLAIRDIVPNIELEIHLIAAHQTQTPIRTIIPLFDQDMYVLTSRSITHVLQDNEIGSLPN